MSRLPFELLLAFRYLRPKRTFVSVITLISVLGVTLGVAVLIIVISVMSGFDRQLRDKILGFNAHLRVFKPGTTMGHFQDALKTVKADPEVLGVAPLVLGQVLVKTQPESGNPVVGAPWVRGIDPRYETNVSTISTSVQIGKFDLEGNGVVVGRELAYNLGLHIGDRVSVYSPRNLEE